MSLIVPPEKVENLSNLCSKTMRMSRVTLRKMAKVIGKFKSTAPAFSWAPLQTRHLQQVPLQTRHLQQVPLSKKAILELKWWIENLELLNGKPITINTPDLWISTDAAKRKNGVGEQNARVLE